MKKLSLMALLVATLVGQSAFSRSVEKDSLLSARIASLLAGGITVSIDVSRNGHVVATQCQAIFPNPCRTESLDYLSRYEMRQLSLAIAKAKRERLSFPDQMDAFCLAVPMEEARYSADGDRALLFSGQRPCGHDVISRNGSATQHLMKFIDKYQAELEG